MMKKNFAWFQWVQWAAVLVALGTGAGRAGAQNINFGNLTERAVLIQTEDSDCTNPALPTTGTSPALATPDSSCFVFANGLGANFSDTTTDFYGVLTHVSGTQWRLTVPQPVWFEVLDTVLSGIGATVGTTTANQMTFNSAGGPVVPTGAAFYTATAAFGSSQLYLEGLTSTPDTVYFGSAAPPPGETLNVPLEFSCAGTQALGGSSLLGPSPSAVFATTTYCDPPGGSTNYLTSPGFSGTSLTAFMATAIQFAPPQGIYASSPVWTPLDWRLQETPDSDGDQVPDLFDNCKYRSNVAQTDSGGLGGSTPDGIGDACQCGDINGDGQVLGNDFIVLNRAAAGLSPYNSISGAVAPGLPGGVGRCNVNANNTGVDAGVGGCASNDALVINRAVAGLSPGIVQQCDAQLPPAD